MFFVRIGRRQMIIYSIYRTDVYCADEPRLVAATQL